MSDDKLIAIIIDISQNVTRDRERRERKIHIYILCVYLYNFTFSAGDYFKQLKLSLIS